LSKNNLSQSNFSTVEEYRDFVNSQMASLKNKDTRREVMQSILGKGKYPNPDNVLNKWMDQASGGDTHFSYEPKGSIDFETMQNALSTASTIEILAKGLSSYVFGGADPSEYISPKNDMKVKNVILPETPKSEKAPFYLSSQKLTEITTNPIIPICRKEDYLVMLGKDTATDKAVVFLAGLPEKNAENNLFADTEMAMFLYVGGIQPKFLGRTSYKPTTTAADCHKQMHIEFGQLSREEDGSLCMDEFHTQVVHYHSYIQDDKGHLPTIITNPLHYTALIRAQDNDYLPAETATCQQAFVDMLGRFNVLTQELPQWSDSFALDYNLQQGALVSLGIMKDTDDFSNVELTSQLYDLILPHYQNFVKTGEASYDDRTLFLTSPEDAKLAEETLGPREEVLPTVSQETSAQTANMFKTPQPLEQ